MKTRAKFKCDEVVRKPDSSEASVSLSAVTSGSEENEKFFAYTPSGQLYLAVLNAEAATMFQAGNEYYIDISPATPIGS